jgi:hypothetical protein
LPGEISADTAIRCTDGQNLHRRLVDLAGFRREVADILGVEVNATTEDMSAQQRARGSPAAMTRDERQRLEDIVMRSEPSSAT